MIRRAMGWIDLLLCVALVSAGIWVIACLPLGLKADSAASLAGAMFGAAAVLLGNWISRSNEQHKAAADLERRSAALKTLIAAELVNLTAGLLDSKRMMDAAIRTIRAGGPAAGQIDLSEYLPRSMPFTESLGVELLLLDGKAIDALTTLRANLAQTRRTMESNAKIVKATFGLSWLIATQISQGLGHDMSILAEVFEHVAPTRKLQLPGEDRPRLVIDVLKNAARSPDDDHQPPGLRAD